MKVNAPLLTLGTDPEPVFTDNGLMVKLNLAENHNKNIGTRENPEWERIGTSWFNFVAFGDVAEDILNEMEKGDALKLVAGRHRKKDIGTKEEPNIVDQYVIYEYSKYAKRD